MNNNYLSHYGVLGMKWGVRRDRSTSGSSRRKRRSDSYSDDYKDYQKLKKRKTSSLSNAELRRLNDRMNLEQNYRRMNPSKISRGMKFVGGLTGAMGAGIALYNNYNTLANIGRKILNK